MSAGTLARIPKVSGEPFDVKPGNFVLGDLSMKYLYVALTIFRVKSLVRNLCCHPRSPRLQEEHTPRTRRLGR